MSMETIKTEYQSELALVEDAKQLSEFWAKYLGKGGQVQKLMEGIKNVPNEEKKAYGQAVNQIKNWAQALYDEKKEEMDKKALLARYEDEAIDVTLPAEHTQAKRSSFKRYAGYILVNRGFITSYPYITGTDPCYG